MHSFIMEYITCSVYYSLTFLCPVLENMLLKTESKLRLFVITASNMASHTANLNLAEVNLE